MANATATLAMEIARPILEEQGIDVVDVEFVKKQNGWYLCVYIDKKGGVGLEECEKATHLLDPIFDETEGIAGKHDFLSVASPGIDRPFKTYRDYLRHVGEKIDISLYSAIEGMKDKKFTSVLNFADEEKIGVDVDGSIIEIEYSQIARASQTIEF